MVISHTLAEILTMIFPYRHILVILVVATKLFAALYGQAYFSEQMSAAESSNTEHICVHDRGVPDHEAQESPQHMIQCLELEQPGLLASDLKILYSPAISTIAASDKDARLPGYRPSIRIPPKSHA